MRTWRYVTLDATGTVIQPAEAPGVTYLRFWERISGQNLSSSRRAAASAALSAHFPLEFRALSTSKPNFGANGKDSTAYNWWHELVLNTMHKTHVASQIPPQLGEQFTRELYGHFATPEAWTVFEDALPALETLQKQEIPVAVISNSDERLGPLLKDLGLRDFFQTVTTSFEATNMKPDAEIFLKTFKELSNGEVNAKEFLHVGDHVRRDYQAAIAVGAQARLVWRNSGEPAPGDVPQRDVVATLEEIL